MLKVLIIDDEPIIREGLKTIIDWESYGFTVCGEAANGRDGLKKIEELGPDLIIVDIKMPGMDGLEMIAELRKNQNPCEIIILTGYSDFNYVQQAIEYGVDSFILKPIDEAELAGKVSKVYKLIENKRKAREYFAETISLSQDKMIEKIITGTINEDLQEKINELYGLQLPWQSYQVLLIEADHKTNREIKWKEKMWEEAEKFWQADNRGYIFHIDGGIGILCKNYNWETNLAALESFRERIAEVIEEEVTLSIGKNVKNIHEVPASYRHACMLLEKKFIYDGVRMIYDQGPEYQMIISGNKELQSHLERAIEELYGAVVANNKESIDHILTGIRTLFADIDESEETIKLNYINLYMMIIHKLIIEHEKLRGLLQINEAVIKEIYKTKSLIELHERIKEKLYMIADELCKERPEGVIEKILDYIGHNYQKELKLEDLARLFNYNCAYLGKLFKNHTGQYFNTYIDLIRMEKAKQLLTEGLKVYQVAEKVGYHDINYFYSKFKKYVGTSPSGYRKK